MYEGLGTGKGESEPAALYSGQGPKKTRNKEEVT